MAYTTRNAKATQSARHSKWHTPLEVAYATRSGIRHLKWHEVAKSKSTTFARSLDCRHFLRLISIDYAHVDFMFAKQVVVGWCWNAHGICLHGIVKLGERPDVPRLVCGRPVTCLHGSMNMLWIMLVLAYSLHTQCVLENTLISHRILITSSLHTHQMLITY